MKWSEATQLCLTICDPVDCKIPGSAVHGIFQARVLEWVAISFSRGSSQPRDWTQVSRIADRHFTLWATREAIILLYKLLIYCCSVAKSCLTLCNHMDYSMPGFSVLLIFVFLMLSFKPAFSLTSFTLIKRLFRPPSLSAVMVVSPA